jgi:hypothetical protein
MRAITINAVLILTAFSLAAAGLRDVKSGKPDTVRAAASRDTTISVAPTSHKVIVYYFHGNVRCVSCRKIEAYTKAAIDSGFTSGIESGDLEWRVVNTDSSQNGHYLEDYKCGSCSATSKSSRPISRANSTCSWTRASETRCRVIPRF